MRSQRPTNHHRVLHAACLLFRQDQYAISMDAVASHAGVSKQTVYSHFDSKQILFRAVVQELVKPLQDALTRSEEPLESLLLAVAQAYQADADGHTAGAIARVFQAEPPRALAGVRDVVDAVDVDARTKLAERLRMAMERGHLRPDDPEVAAELFFSLVRGLRSGAALIDAVVHLFLDAYRAVSTPLRIRPFHSGPVTG